MKPATSKTKVENKSVSPFETQKLIENHIKTATHLEIAAKYHQDAARFYETENSDKATQSRIKTEEHVSHANKIQKEFENTKPWISAL